MAKCYDFKCPTLVAGTRHPTGYLDVGQMIDADMEVERANFLISYYNLDSLDQNGTLSNWTDVARQHSLTRLKEGIDKLYPAI